jgi:hypothetical protein
MKKLDKTVESKQGVSFVKSALLLGLPLVGLCLSLAMANAAQRPITDFTDRQGAYRLGPTEGPPACEASHYRLPGEGDGFLWVPPILNFNGWSDPKTAIFLSADYAGLAYRWLKNLGVDLGTTQDGSITERPLKDGRAEVSVILHTRNALTWALDGNSGDFATGTLLFGCRAPDVLAGDTPAVGDCTLQVKFINTAPGAPLPDLQELFFCPAPGMESLTLSFTAQAKGPIRAAFGLPEGTPGFLQTRQTGLLATAAKANPNSRVALDSFPAEKIMIQPIGK